MIGTVINDRTIESGTHHFFGFTVTLNDPLSPGSWDFTLTPAAEKGNTTAALLTLEDARILLAAAWHPLGYAIEDDTADLYRFSVGLRYYNAPWPINVLQTTWGIGATLEQAIQLAVDAAHPVPGFMPKPPEAKP